METERYTPQPAETSYTGIFGELDKLVKSTTQTFDKTIIGHGFEEPIAIFFGGNK